MTRRSILVFTRRYLPGYKAGGPIQSVANLVRHLHDEFDFSIVTSDRDSGDEIPYENVPSDEWMEVGQARVKYLSRGQWTRSKLESIVRDEPCDALYLNSFFNYPFSIRPMLLRRSGRLPSMPVVLAPRGEFAEGALRIKPKKKRLFLALAKSARLHADVLWQATSEYERQEICCLFGQDAKVHVAPNIPSIQPRDGVCASRPKQQGELRVVFFSRIARKKNLDFLLQQLAHVQGQVELSIHGPLEDESYWEICSRQIKQLPDHIRVRYAGPLRHEEVGQVLSQYDLFAFPTWGENYGHVILEALGCGLPVLISDRTPWRDLKSKGIGWDIPLDQPVRFREAFQICVEMSPEEFALWKHRAREFAESIAHDETVISQNRQLFRLALADDSSPVKTACEMGYE